MGNFLWRYRVRIIPLAFLVLYEMILILTDATFEAHAFVLLLVFAAFVLWPDGTRIADRPGFGYHPGFEPLLFALAVILVLVPGILMLASIGATKSAVPDWNRPFVNDAAVVGTWESVDYVRTIDDFKPGQKKSAGDLFLKGLTFKPDGTTSESRRKWTKGYVWYRNDRAEGQYTIKVLDGTKYLFMEWINGDVLIRHEKPRYYVLTPKS